MTGICKGGPWNGKVRTFRHRRVDVADDGRNWTEGGVIAKADGTYYFRPQQGPLPGQWLWAPVKKGND